MKILGEILWFIVGCLMVISLYLFGYNRGWDNGYSNGKTLGILEGMIYTLDLIEDGIKN